MKDFIKKISGYLFKSHSIMDFNEFLHECRSIYLGRIPRAERILSVGCAGIWYFEWFNKHYRYPISEHIGMDLNPRPEGLPKDIMWIQHDASDLSPISSGYIDMIFAGQFIEHISWDQQFKFLVEANRVLKPYGVFVLDSPNFPVTNRYGWRHPEHVHELSFSQMNALSRLAGFEVTSSHGILPKELLGIPPDRMGELLTSGMHDAALNRRDIRKAIDADPQDSFIWWIFARKNTERFDKEKLKNTLREYYETNVTNRHRIVFSKIGTLVAKGKEHFIQVSPSDGHGFALFGPYEIYPPGDYTADFGISLSGLEYGSNPEARVCIIDVVADVGNTVFAKKEVKVGQLSTSHSVKLEFALDASMPLEFRVLSLGFLPFSVNTRVNVIKRKDK
jgi:SAM-dependent methyltransferase